MNFGLRRTVKIRIIVNQSEDQNRTIESPVTCRFGDRDLSLGVMQRKNSVTGKTDTPPLWVISAHCLGEAAGLISLSGKSWRTPQEAFVEWKAGFEVADPKGGTEEGKFVAELIRQGVAEEVK